MLFEKKSHLNNTSNENKIFIKPVNEALNNNRGEDIGPVLRKPNQKSKNNNNNSSSALVLEEENQRLKNERLCVICITQDKNVLFLPCAHLTSCLECSESLPHCPLCRSEIQARIRTFN